MENNTPTHLLSTLGVLASFSISKKITKTELDKLTKKVKKAMREEDPVKFQKMIAYEIIENTKNYIKKGLPPGLKLSAKDEKKNKLDRFYMELSAVSHVISQKFLEQKFNKHQVCFIINAILNILGVSESDFEEFYKTFSRYRENNVDGDENDETNNL